MRRNRLVLLAIVLVWSPTDGASADSEQTPEREAGDVASVEADATAARDLLKAFVESRKPGDLVSNPDLVMERARKVGAAFRKVYQYESLRHRLEYETTDRSGYKAPKLAAEAAELLDRHDTRFAWESEPGRLGQFRQKSLAKLHAEQVAQFVAREGFGWARMPSPPSPLYWEMPSAPTIPFAIAPHDSNQQEGEEVESLPKQITKYDLARLHADEPTWTDQQVERKYYDRLTYDEKMKAMFETYAAWREKHNPLNLPSRNLLFDSHDDAVLDFGGSGRNGYVQDLDHVVGFGSHSMTKMPRFEPGPIELRYWPNTSKEKPVQWIVTQLQLISLLKYDTPNAYVSNTLPKMADLQDAHLRPLNDFESASLARLLDGEQIALDIRANRIRMLGALRASKQCLQCHQVNRGELLGAFSYELVRAKLHGS